MEFFVRARPSFPLHFFLTCLLYIICPSRVVFVIASEIHVVFLRDTCGLSQRYMWSFSEIHVVFLTFKY